MQRMMAITLFIFGSLTLSATLFLGNLRQETSGAYWVAYEAFDITNRNYGFSNIEVMISDGRSAYRVNSDTYQPISFSPAWLSSNTLLYTNLIDNSIYITSSHQPLPHLYIQGATIPRPSPNSVYIAYNRGNHIEVLQRETGVLVLQTDSESVSELNHYNPVWMPDSASLFYIAVLPEAEMCVYQIYLDNKDTINHCDKIGNVRSLRFSLSPHGEWLAFETVDINFDKQPVIAWHLPSEQSHQLVGYSRGQSRLGWSPDSQQLLTLDDGNLYLENVAQGTIQTIPLSNQILDMAWSPDGRGFYYAQRENSIGNIYWRDANGQNPVRLIAGNSTYEYYNPTPSPLIDLAWHKERLAMLCGVLLLFSIGWQVAIKGQGASKP